MFITEYAWSPSLGEKARTIMESSNNHNCYAIAVLDHDTLCTIGHLPMEISKECFYFI